MRAGRTIQDLEELRDHWQAKIDAINQVITSLETLNGPQLHRRTVRKMRTMIDHADTSIDALREEKKARDRAYWQANKHKYAKGRRTHGQQEARRKGQHNQLGRDVILPILLRSKRPLQNREILTVLQDAKIPINGQYPLRTTTVVLATQKRYGFVKVDKEGGWSLTAKGQKAAEAPPEPASQEE